MKHTYNKTGTHYSIQNLELTFHLQNLFIWKFKLDFSFSIFMFDTLNAGIYIRDTNYICVRSFYKFSIRMVFTSYHTNKPGKIND